MEVDKLENSFDVAIVGGGINGASIAYQLSKIGRKVIIIEKNQLACQASSAAAGSTSRAGTRRSLFPDGFKKSEDVF
jgi:glycine/D-amino acid oxidase-like deaminating enzyme